MKQTIRGFLSGHGYQQPARFLRWHETGHCSQCDAIQPLTASSRCLQCGTMMVSLAKLLRLQREQIARLTNLVRTLEQQAKPKRKGTIRPWDPKLFLGRKVNS